MPFKTLAAGSCLFASLWVASHDRRSDPQPSVLRDDALFAVVAATPDGASHASLPNKRDSLKFAVIGDNGTGDGPQYELGAEMKTVRDRFPFALVLMLGDNFYGAQRPDDLQRKFDRPYAVLLEAGVRFHAVVGNHDEPHTVDYPPLNMDGRRYYTFADRDVRFFAIDSNALDPRQLAWLTSALAAATERWKIAYFHHPLYSNGNRHGSSLPARVALEPLLVRHGVSVVFSGHDHVYERLVPQRGITYFVCGSGGQLRRGGLTRAATTAAGYDQDRVFLVAEIDGDHLFFEAVTTAGDIVDSGVIQRRLNGS
jgi:hypothetical protein